MASDRVPCQQSKMLSFLLIRDLPHFPQALPCLSQAILQLQNLDLGKQGRISVWTSLADKEMSLPAVPFLEP